MAQSSEQMRTHFAIVAAVHLFLGGLKLLLGAVFAGPAALFTAYWLLTALRFASSGGGGETGEAVVVAIGVSSFGLLGMGIGAIAMVFSIPDLATAYGVVRRRTWAPTVALLTSALTLFNAPIGTTVGVYTIWALWSPEGREAY